MLGVEAAAQLNVWPRLCRAKSALVFANSFGPLGHFKVGCGTEELAQGLSLVSLVRDAGLPSVKCSRSVS